MSTLAQSETACEDFKQDVLKGNIISAQKKLDALKVLTKLVSCFIEILSELTGYSFLQDLLLDCDSLPPIVSNTANAQAEQAIARETLEYAVILSIKSGDKSSFQRYLSSLRPYYTASRWAHNRDDGINAVIFASSFMANVYFPTPFFHFDSTPFTKTIILLLWYASQFGIEIVTILLYDRDAPETEIMCTILGLNLLYLLVENRLADFHCEVSGYAVKHFISF